MPIFNLLNLNDIFDFCWRWAKLYPINGMIEIEIASHKWNGLKQKGNTARAQFVATLVGLSYTCPQAL